MKQTNNRKDMMSFDDFLKRQFNQVKYKPKKTDTYQPTSMTITKTKSIPSHTIDVKDLQHACTKPNDDYKKEYSTTVTKTGIESIPRQINNFQN